MSAVTSYAFILSPTSLTIEVLLLPAAGEIINWQSFPFSVGTNASNIPISKFKVSFLGTFINISFSDMLNVQGMAVYIKSNWNVCSCYAIFSFPLFFLYFYYRTFREVLVGLVVLILINWWFRRLLMRKRNLDKQQKLGLIRIYSSSLYPLLSYYVHIKL